MALDEEVIGLLRRLVEGVKRGVRVLRFWRRGVGWWRNRMRSWRYGGGERSGDGDGNGGNGEGSG